MPVIVLLVIIAVVAVCAAAFFGYRAYKHRTLAEKLDKRDDDQVHYAFIVNPSKPQAEQRKQHIKEFCEAKHLTQIEFIETQLDKDGRACAFEALDHGADVVVAVGGSTAYFTASDLDFRTLTDRFEAGTALLLGACCLALWLLSMALSVRIYRRRAL